MPDVAETIEQSGHRIGGHAWVEMRLFEKLGRWSAAVDEPRARVVLATASRHRAVHAAAWTSLLPALPHLPTVDLVGPADGAASALAALDALDDAPTADRLAALVDRVFPHVIDRYTSHLQVAVPVADGPTTRALAAALADAESAREALAGVAETLDG